MKALKSNKPEDFLNDVQLEKNSNMIYLNSFYKRYKIIDKRLRKSLEDIVIYKSPSTIEWKSKER